MRERVQISRVARAWDDEARAHAKLIRERAAELEARAAEVEIASRDGIVQMLLDEDEARVGRTARVVRDFSGGIVAVEFGDADNAHAHDAHKESAP